VSKGFTSGMRSSSDDTWTTPRDFYDKLNAEFNFSLDAAALKESALCDNWFGPDHDNPNLRDGLVMDWAQFAPSKTIWLNPPYGRSIGIWTSKANFETRGGGD
jgi:phage N-6-adenine-methyltransferase